jgi:hypothetical protein
MPPLETRGSLRTLRGWSRFSTVPEDTSLPHFLALQAACGDIGRETGRYLLQELARESIALISKHGSICGGTEGSHATSTRTMGHVSCAGAPPQSVVLRMLMSKECMVFARFILEGNPPLLARPFELLAVDFRHIFDDRSILSLSPSVDCIPTRRASVGVIRFGGQLI